VALNYSTADDLALAERARQHNARIVEGPVDRPWNICEADPISRAEPKAQQ
jgi:hypothetical protein